MLRYRHIDNTYLCSRRLHEETGILLDLILECFSRLFLCLVLWSNVCYAIAVLAKIEYSLPGRVLLRKHSSMHQSFLSTV